SLLIESVGAASPADLVPARAGDARPCLYRLVRHERFVCTKVAVGEAKCWPLAIREDVEVAWIVDGNARLRQAVPRRRRAGEDRVEAGNWKLRLEDDGRHRIGQPLHAEFPN